MSVAMEDFPRRQGITVDEYHQMAEVGLIAPDARVELIDGEIIDMPPMGSRHAATVDRLSELLSRAVGERAIVRCQGTIQLGNLSEPQPDLVLLVRREDFYAENHPTAGNTLLVIEVSETTLRFDLGKKMALYARHGVPELWVLDVPGKQLHVFRNPSGTSYEETFSSDTPGIVPIGALPGVAVDLSFISE